jgi:mycothiol S-conjugate amidase
VARYAAAGVGTVLVCCTGGEAGTVLNPALKRPEVQARLAEVRRQELAAATAHLGYQRDWMLGYRDSNMPASGAPGTFAVAPIEETIWALVRLIRQERPHVIVTYSDNQRGYPHPDHLRVHEASVPAYKAASDPAFHPEWGGVGPTEALLRGVVPGSASWPCMSICSSLASCRHPSRSGAGSDDRRWIIASPPDLPSA